MADKTVNVGNQGRWRIFVQQMSQNISGNSSRVRVIGRLYNDGTARSYSGDDILKRIAGSFSWEDRGGFDVPAGGSFDVMEEYFTVGHDRTGNATVTGKIYYGDTGTYTFGTPGWIEVSLKLDQIPQEPEAPGAVSTSFTAPTTVNTSWDASTSYGASMLEYQLQWDDASGFTSPTTASTGTSRSRTVTGLSIGKRWWFRARGRNSRGWGPWSNPTYRDIPNVPNGMGAPSASLNLPSTVSLSWVSPDNNGATILEYQVQYDDNTGFTSAATVSAGTAWSKSIGGLAVGRNWYFRVRARNSQGWGAWSGARGVTIPGVPAAVAAPSLVYTPATTMKISWAAPSNGGASISWYDIQYADNPSFSGVKSVATQGTSVTVTDLTVGPTWYFRVRAKNSQGGGPWGPASSFLVVCGPQINVNGVYKNTVAYVNVNGVWKTAIPYVNVAGAYKIAGG